MSRRESTGERRATPFGPFTVDVSTGSRGFEPILGAFPSLDDGARESNLEGLWRQWRAARAASAACTQPPHPGGVSAPARMPPVVAVRLPPAGHLVPRTVTLDRAGKQLSRCCERHFMMWGFTLSKPNEAYSCNLMKLERLAAARRS